MYVQGGGALEFGVCLDCHGKGG